MSGEDHHWRRIASFLLLAREECDASGLLIETNPRQAAFFQQQSVEKLVRAVIEFERTVAGPTHSLGALTDLLGQTHPFFSRFKQFDELSSAAARFRYPAGYGGVPSVSSNALSVKQVDIRALILEVTEFIGPLKNG